MDQTHDTAEGLIDVRDAIRARIKDWEELSEGAPSDDQIRQALAVLQGTTTIPLPEEIRKSLDGIRTAARYVPVGDGYYDLYDSNVEAVDAAVERAIKKLTPQT